MADESDVDIKFGASTEGIEEGAEKATAIETALKAYAGALRSMAKRPEAGPMTRQ
jgi:hypothetical protein